ncbi:F420-0--gamma-glutamyl ligase [Candidatus Uhrbacteria bacterium CG10_big_fil_rev_8_21_14_0_10_50_16]|uniref:F420-0--gamma-glutamyl ligase n=1 Tax=Candidatus Uhrbacteria bacterium CG10_big_fil_rev_8_21_14_0_10_50_16 TaxID=1975039 RepID=A0A2H0RNX1_9BACT|nr:MAG: F420-0--gamma-glutamyl ligase [Candidatus Uhrbacteria bacterium CG10_big_fil_rev_8_21_14_0_10_50_16]
MKNSITIGKHKNKSIHVGGRSYDRLPIKTPLITKEHNLVDVCVSGTKSLMQQDDILFVSEKIVAISQGRAYPLMHIHPRPLAVWLSQYVSKSPNGIGLASPYTMELAFKQAGVARMLLATVASALTRPFGIHGVFYLVAGNSVNAIDGPCDFAIPPYNHYAKMAPQKPSRVAKELKRELGFDVVVIDANDLGVNILGKSSRKISTRFCKELFKDNPMGQSTEQTPICIVRLAA